LGEGDSAIEERLKGGVCAESIYGPAAHRGSEQPLADRLFRYFWIGLVLFALVSGIGLMVYKGNLEVGLRNRVAALRIGNSQREVEERLGPPVRVYATAEAARREAGGHLRSRPENVLIPESAGAVMMYRTSGADELFLLYFDSQRRLERRVKLIHRDGPPGVVDLEVPTSGGLPRSGGG
jgi:hypothetical protein